MGDDDLIIKVKYHNDDYRPYVTVDLKDIDSNDTVPEWDLVMKKRNPPRQERTITRFVY